jgi:hypothetical protein
MFKWFEKKTITVYDSFGAHKIVVENVDLIIGPTLSYTCRKVGKKPSSTLDREYSRYDQIDANIFDSYTVHSMTKIVMKKGDEIYLRWQLYSDRYAVEADYALRDKALTDIAPLRKAVDVYRAKSVWWKLARKILMGVFIVLSAIATTIVIVIKGKK